MSSPQAPDSTDFCDDCQRSVDLDDSNFRNFRNVFSDFKAEPHYERRDTMPHLPSLLFSANAGCSFCRFIRQTILDDHGSNPSWKAHPEDLMLSFRYTWRVRLVWG